MKNYKANIVCMTSIGKQITIFDIETSALNELSALENILDYAHEQIVNRKSIRINNVVYLTNRIDYYHLDNLRVIDE